MTGPHSETEDGATRQISVAELLARNGTIGAPAPTRRRRRRRGDSDSVTVAELTGEIPIIRDEPREAGTAPPPSPAPEPANGRVQVAEPAPPPAPEPVAEPVVEEAVTHAPEAVPEDAIDEAVEEQTTSVYWSQPEPRWPKSDPLTRRGKGLERSEYPRPLRYSDDADADRVRQSGAEDMSPDPVEHYVDTSVDVAEDEVPTTTAEEEVEDSAYARSYLQASEGTLFGGQSLADEVARRRSEQTPSVFDEEDLERTEADKAEPATGTLSALWRGAVIVLQSVLAVAFGAGLFLAFDQLWRWNSIVALVLSVLVILGLVVGVRVVRKTEDIASTLIAVAVGALITLGPLALLQSG